MNDVEAIAVKADQLSRTRVSVLFLALQLSKSKLPIMLQQAARDMYALGLAVVESWWFPSATVWIAPLVSLAQLSSHSFSQRGLAPPFRGSPMRSRSDRESKRPAVELYLNEGRQTQSEL